MKQLPRPTFCWTLLTLVLALVLTLAFSVPLAADSPGSDPEASFGELVDVRVINLEVVVTDGGKRVGDLTAEDFRLLVDGSEVPVEFFTEVQGGRAMAPSETAPSETASSETASSETAGTATVPALEPGVAVGTRYLVFIDETFAIPAHRNRVLKGFSEQLGLLGPEDHMAVVAFDGTQIDLLSTWTGSLPELERVFDAARERKAYGLYNGNGRFGTLDPFERQYLGPRFSVGRGRYGYRGTPRGSRIAMQVDRVVDAATSVLRGFAKPPGRKVMLLFSGGWPSANWEAFASSVSYGAWGPDHQVYSPLIDTANRLGYTLYPVDMKGVENHLGSAEYATPGEAEYAARVSRDREWVEEGALSHIARQTGGRAHLDGAGLKALERTINDTRSYYWLGFSPTWLENDERHRVKIEMNRKGLKVRTRKNFTDLSRQTEITMLIESAQIFDLPMPGETTDLTVSFGEPVEGGFRKVTVPMKVAIPYERITLLPEQGGFVGQLELRVAVTDDRGDSADIPVIPIELSTKESPAAGDVMVYELGLKLRRRDHKMLISVHDATSGAILSRRVELSL